VVAELSGGARPLFRAVPCRMLSELGARHRVTIGAGLYTGRLRAGMKSATMSTCFRCG